MTPIQILAFMKVAEKLKSELRHSWTSSGRQESVAEHSWRLCLLVYLIQKDYPDYDMDKVMKMCLFHDIGEALAGDIPAFEKTAQDEILEQEAIQSILNMLEEDMRLELIDLFEEMDALVTKEAKLFKALDKLEAVIQHNEASLETWLPLEYAMNQTYGVEEAHNLGLVEALRAQVLKDTLKKIHDEG